MSAKLPPLSTSELRKLAKGQIHEHIDCSTDPHYMLRRWWEIGFDKMEMKLAPAIEEAWQAAQVLRQSESGNNSDQKKEIEQLEKNAASQYKKWLATFASKSLANYVQAIGDHVLPLMQTEGDLFAITAKRIEDAVEDGHIFLELRFAPQLHTMQGLTINQVMDSVSAAVKQSPIPIKLIICALRHEGNQQIVPHNPVDELADLCINHELVGAFDLAADEASYPGVLSWWLKAAKRVQQAGKLADIHLGETQELTHSYSAGLDELYNLLTNKDRENLATAMNQIVTMCSQIGESCDVDQRINLFDQITSKLDSVEDLIYKSGRLGHGIKGDQQGTYVLGICPTSNVVTGQIPSLAEHPISKFFRAGKLITINTDGTLFTDTTLSEEYDKLQMAPHNFGLIEFYICNRIGLAASSFPSEIKSSLRAKLTHDYKQRISTAGETASAQALIAQ